MKNIEKQERSGQDQPEEYNYDACKDCGAGLPAGKSRRSRACRIMGLCLGCHVHRFPPHFTGGVEDVFEPDLKEPSDSPCEWRESVQIMYGEKNGYEK